MRIGIVAVLAACGGGGERPVDAGVSTGSVTVVVTEHGAPVVGVPVVFQSADAATTFTAVTAADGSSGFDLADGSVTVIVSRGTVLGEKLWTFAGVAPNDVLRLELAKRPTQTAELAVTVNPDVVSGPLLLYASCGDMPVSAIPGGITRLFLECERDVIDLLAVRTDPNTHQPLASQFLGNVPLAAGAVAMPAGYSAVPAIPITYASPRPFPAFYTAEEIATTNGLIFRSTSVNTSTPIITRPAAGNARRIITAGGQVDDTARDEQRLYRVADESSPLAVDLAPHLPIYTSLGTMTGGKLVWSQTGGTVTATYARATVHFEDADRAWEWAIVTPRTAASEIAFPPLPPNGDLIPDPRTSTATVFELTNVHVPGGYDHVRPTGFDDPEDRRATLAPGDLMVIQRQFAAFPI